MHKQSKRNQGSIHYVNGQNLDRVCVNRENVGLRLCEMNKKVERMYLVCFLLFDICYKASLNNQNVLFRAWRFFGCLYQKCKMSFYVVKIQLFPSPPTPLLWVSLPSCLFLTEEKSGLSLEYLIVLKNGFLYYLFLDRAISFGCTLTFPFCLLHHTKNEVLYHFLI